MMTTVTSKKISFLVNGTKTITKMEFPIARGTEMPKQRVSYAEKQQAKWYEASIDYVINKCLSASNKERTLKLSRIQKGDIPSDVYAKTLNPYNATDAKLLRFPATMRNYDIMGDSIRRYVSEYTKAVHDFVVTAGNPDVSFNRDEELKQAVTMAAQQLFVAELQQKMQEAQQSGQQVSDPMSMMPSPEEFVHDFNKKQLDGMATQAQSLIDVIDNVLQTDLLRKLCLYWKLFLYIAASSLPKMKICLTVDSM